MKNYLIAVVGITLLLTSACKSPDTNKNFLTLAPSSKQYKRELIREFLDRGTTNLTFNFQGLKTVDGKDYMEVLISGNGLQAQSLVLINNWNKLEGIRQAKGGGYKGAELKDLQLDIDNTYGEPTLVYRDVAKIID